MEKVLTFALGSIIVLALILGAALGVAWGMSRAWSSPEVVQAVARQERARAESLEAQAEAERHSAMAAGELARSVAALTAELNQTWGLWVLGALVAFVITALGVAVAVARSANMRAAVRDLGGGVLVVNSGGALAVLDMARLAGVSVAGGEVESFLALPDDLAADVARAALVARAVEKVGANEGQAAIVAQASGALSEAFKNIAGAVSPMAHDVSGGPSLRFIKVRSPEKKAQDDTALEVVELREFIEQGAVRGFVRRNWANYTFASTGRRLSQTRWKTFASWLNDANVLDNGALTCSVSEVLERLELTEEKAEVQNV